MISLVWGMLYLKLLGSDKQRTVIRTHTLTYTRCYFFIRKLSITRLIFNIPYTQKHIDENYRYRDERGLFALGQLKAPGNRGPKFDWKGIVRHWRYTETNMRELDNKGLLYYSKSGIPWKKLYLEQMPGVVAGTIWTDINPIHAQDTKERLDYITQKPEALLERIIQASSKEGDLVADFFCGSATTGAVDFEWEPEKPFNHHWQEYRTRKDRSLKTVSDALHRFPGPGTYTAYVKVVDTFGCDTSITVEISL
jgi:hypothetical protein